MALSGTRKAALLIRSLDARTAGELLKSASPQVVKEIAAELAYMDVSGPDKGQVAEQAIREFFGLLAQSKSKPSGDNYVKTMLESALGKDHAGEVLGQIQQMVEARDPFMQIREADVELLAQAMAGESAGVAGMVLSELPPKKSTQLLGLLDEKVRFEAISGMAGGDDAPPEVRLRVATVVRKRLQAFSGGGSQEVAAIGPAIAPAAGTAAQKKKQEQQLRKVAVVLRGLKPELRDAMIATIAKRDKEASEMVARLMVVWEDLPTVMARSLQEVLRTIDSRRLALALVEADPAIAQKVRQNISERAVAMLEEETSLLSSPKPEDITEAREAILAVLREMNVKGELRFEET